MSYRMFSAFLLLLFSPAALANMWDGKAILPHCQQLNIAVPASCRSQVPPEELLFILPLADKILKDEQVLQAQAYSKKRLLDELDTSLDARKTMLDCLDNLGNEHCALRVNALRDSLEANVKRLRVSLALSKETIDQQDHTISPMISYPSSLGSGGVPPLGVDEISFARNFQRSTLASIEHVGISKMRQEMGIAINESGLREKCRLQDANFIEACQRLNDIHERSFNQFRQSMLKISDSLISRLPLTLRFKSVPINKEQLRTELEFSRATLQQWREENAKPVASGGKNALANALPFADEYAAHHPEACSALEENILHSSRASALIAGLKTGSNVVGMGTLCTLASPLVCFSVGTAMGGYGLRTQYGEWSTVRRRLSSADHENPQANLTLAHNKYRDLLVNVALTTAGTAMGVSGTFLGDSEVSLQLMATDLEGESGSFFSQAGTVFEKMSTQMYAGLKGTAISTTVQQVADLSQKDPATTYFDWLRSDAFTARVYEVFETDFAYKSIEL
jgi:hypothetical protein